MLWLLFIEAILDMSDYVRYSKSMVFIECETITFGNHYAENPKLSLNYVFEDHSIYNKTANKF